MRILPVLIVAPLLTAMLGGCRLGDRDPEIAQLKHALVDGSWSRFSEVYYPGRGRPIAFLSFGLVVHDGDQLTQSWAVREPDFVEFTNFRNETRQYRWYGDHAVMAHCRLGFGKPFLMAPDSLGYDEVITRAKAAGVYNCDGPAVLSIAGAEVERLEDSARTAVAVDLRGIELNWQIKNAIRDLGTIRRINLSCSEIDDSDLEYLLGLPHVEELNLSNTPVTDLGLVRLAGLRELKMIQLGGTRTTQRGVESFKERIPEVSVDSLATKC